MLDLRKWKADIECSYKDKVMAAAGDITGVTVEFWAVNRDEAERKLDWILEGYRRSSDYYRKRNWYDLEEVEDE